MARGSSTASAFGRGVVSALLIIMALLIVFAAMALGTWLGYSIISAISGVIGVVLGIAVFLVISGAGVYLCNMLEIDA